MMIELGTNKDSKMVEETVRITIKADLTTPEGLLIALNIVEAWVDLPGTGSIFSKVRQLGKIS